MTREDRRLWCLGRLVLFALPRESRVLKPRPEEVKRAAEALKISQAAARKSLDFYVNN